MAAVLVGATTKRGTTAQWAALVAVVRTRLPVELAAFLSVAGMAVLEKSLVAPLRALSRAAEAGPATATTATIILALALLAASASGAGNRRTI